MEPWSNKTKPHKEKTMSLFADFEAVPLPKKQPKPKSTSEWLHNHINDQRRILDGEEVKSSTGKTLKKLWWDRDRNIIDVRFGRATLEKGKGYVCNDEETFKKFLNILEDYEKNPKLTATIESLHNELSKPKGLMK